MDDLLMIFSSPQSLGWQQILCSLVMTFVLCSVFATVYRWTFHGLSYSRGFVHTMILGGMVTCMLIMAIGNNLARGLGILGTLAIVRFRTPIREPLDMIFLFASLGVGIACGANTFNVAILGTFCLSVVALYLHWSPVGSKRNYEGLLRFMMPANPSCEEQVKELMVNCCSSFTMIAMREAAQGELIEYSYQVRLADPSYHSDLVEGLRRLEEVKQPNLHLRRTTVEL
jgi:uncharacterized membrane protein YhiD involved in acid resistance